MRLFITAILAPLVLLHATADAHHSPARFDMGQTITVDGVVTRVHWANPHVYIYVEQASETGDAIEWEVEAVGPDGLGRLGWSRDTLRAGDRVTVSGNPVRNGDVKVINLTLLRHADRTLYDPQGLMGVLSAAGEASEAAASSLEGVWGTRLALEVIVPLSVQPQGALALTAAGTEALEGYDERTMSPAIDCTPNPSPFFMYIPDIKRITTSDGVITIEGSYDPTERTIRMDVGDHSEATRSLQGHSIGWWEDGVLVIDTTHFSDHATGNAFGVPSSAQKHLVERLTLNDDRTGLTYWFELTDPEFLAEPITGEVEWAYRPDLEFAPVPCELESARRFLNE